MPLAMIIWLVVCGLIGATWSMRHMALSRAARTNRRLHPGSPRLTDDACPRLSVLVAAKDEEENIATCIRTLVDQDYPNYEIIAVNDRSDDRTGEILDALQTEFPEKVRALHVTHLPEGWFGKNNAMRTGIEAADGDWLCMVDADCRQTSPATLSVAMAEALREGIDFLSVMPVLETKSFWERVIQPVCAAILVIWFNPAKVNDPKAKAAYANGAFMLMSRENYDAIGRHEAVRTELNEDMHMARRTKELQRRLKVVENDGLYLTRMYASFTQAWRGWSRIFYGCFKTFRRLSVTLAVVVMASVFPFISFVVAALGYAMAGADTATYWGWALLTTGLVVVLLESVIFRFMRLVRAAPWAWMTYPIGAILGVGMLLAAIRKVGGSATTTWRGTTYRGDAHASVSAEELSASQAARENPVTEKQVVENPVEPTADVA